MKTQVVVIHGGNTFNKYKDYLRFLKTREVSLENLRIIDWKSTLGKNLGGRYDVLAPQMPNNRNASYREWKIWFERIADILNQEVILVGHSLGGIFLAKYLSEDTYPKNILATFIIAAPFDDKDSEYTLADFKLPKSLKKFEKQGGKITLYHSKDDPVVAVNDVKKYQLAIPTASMNIFKDRAHFNQPEFPELVKDIKKIVQN